MEFWEKEYLKVLDEVEQNKNSRKRRRNRPDQISKQWEEVVQEDGTKIYVPKVKSFRRSKRRHAFFVGLKQGFKVLAKIAVCAFLLVLLLRGLPALKNIKTNLDFSFVNSALLPAPHNTYINGSGMHDMVETLWDIRNKQTDKLNAYVASGYSYSKDELSVWNNDIKDDFMTVKNLQYDSSYDAVIEACMAALVTLQEFIGCSYSEDWLRAQEFYNKYNSSFDSMQSALIQAFEENGVEHSLVDGGVSFRYQNH